MNIRNLCVNINFDNYNWAKAQVLLFFTSPQPKGWGNSVRPAWAITWRCKSAMNLAVGIISLRQGCPS